VEFALSHAGHGIIALIFLQVSTWFLPSAKGDKLVSQDAVSQIIGRAVVDAAFRELLFSDPDQALESYDLTDDEIEALENLQQEDLEDFSTKLDSRITKRAWRGA
jgi:hypothetical protein